MITATKSVAKAKPGARKRTIKATKKRIAPTLKKNRARAQALIADVKRREARIIEDFYVMGKALAELAEPRLYSALGHRSFGELLKKNRLISRTTAHKLITVYQTYTKAQAHRLGLEKAYALTTYVAATPEDDLARSLLKADALIDGRPLSEVSVRQLRAAATRTRRAASRTRRKPEAQRTAERAARTLQRTLRQKGARTAKVTAQRQGADYRLVIDLALEDAGLVWAAPPS